MLKIAIVATLSLMPLASQAAMTKSDDGFSSGYIVGQGPGDPITKAAIGDEATYWVKVDNIEPGRSYKTRCVVTNTSGEVVSDEQFEDSTKATHGYLHCPYVVEASDTYRFAISVDGKELSQGEIEAERRIFGMKKNVFIATFIAVPLVVVFFAWRRKKSQGD